MLPAAVLVVALVVIGASASAAVCCGLHLPAAAVAASFRELVCKLHAVPETILTRRGMALAVMTALDSRYGTGALLLLLCPYKHGISSTIPTGHLLMLHALRCCLLN